MTKLFALLAAFGVAFAAPAFAAPEAAPAKKAEKAAEMEKAAEGEKDMKEAAPAAGEKTVKKDEMKKEEMKH